MDLAVFATMPHWLPVLVVAFAAANTADGVAGVLSDFIFDNWSA
jgi:hypothetical protein